MKIMTFNTQHCLNYTTQEIDFSVMAEAIKICDPDIVGLNEMRGLGEEKGFEEQVEILASLTGFKYYYFGEAIKVRGNNPYGNGILSKYPFKSIEKIMIPDPQIKTGERHYETRCIIKAVFGNGVSVLVSHFGLNRDEQKNAVKTVLENLETEKCILMGDFNLRPENEILNPIRAVMKDVSSNDDDPMFTFPSDNPTRKIDYIFVSEDIEVYKAEIPQIIASDHRPHTAEILF